jgi:hypothetical protein
MINKLKTFATAILVTGATVIATNAPADPSTNMQVVDNVQIALKFYSQGALKANNKGVTTSLPVVTQTYTTADLLSQLAKIGTVPGYTTFTKSDKLVYTTSFGDIYVTNPPLVTNASLSTNVDVAAVDNADNLTVTVGGVAVGTNEFETYTNVVITNQTLYYGTNTFPGTALTTNTFIVTSNTTPISTNVFDTNTGAEVVITASPTTGDISNFNILSLTGTVITVYTNSSSPSVSYLGILTAANNTSSGATVIPLTNFVSDGQRGSTIYQEAGKDLTTSNFLGTNITSETTYKDSTLTVTAFVTNDSTSVTNLYFQVAGFDKSVLKAVDLTVKGTAKTPKQIFDLNGSENFDVSGYGAEGGVFTNSAAATNAPFTTSQFVSSEFPDAAPGVTNGTYSGVSGYLTNATPIVIEGTITTSFLKAYPQ